MYLPEHFAENRPEVLQQLMREHPLACVVTHGADGLDANHLPLFFDGSTGPHGTLYGHVARSNPLWQQIAAMPEEALIIFQGAQAYISPNWYPGKAEHGQAVPTWNYAVVHARGPLRVVDDPAALRQLLERLTARHEAGQPQPWQLSDAPDDYLQRQLRAIVGIEIPLSALVGKWKCSQNRPAGDRAGVAAALAALPDDNARCMAELVQGRTR